MDKKGFVNWIYRSCSGEVDPVFITAQAILESGWGKHVIGKYNFFGVKRGSWKGNYLLVTTREVLPHNNLRLKLPERVVSCTQRPDGKFDYVCKMSFRDYSSLDEALRDHEDVLRGFKDAWEYRKDGRKFVQALQSGSKRYATDPNYVNTIISLFRSVKMRLENE